MQQSQQQTKNQPASTSPSPQTATASPQPLALPLAQPINQPESPHRPTPTPLRPHDLHLPTPLSSPLHRADEHASHSVLLSLSTHSFRREHRHRSTEQMSLLPIPRCSPSTRRSHTHSSDIRGSSTTYQRPSSSTAGRRTTSSLPPSSNNTNSTSSRPLAPCGATTARQHRRSAYSLHRFSSPLTRAQPPTPHQSDHSPQQTCKGKMSYSAYRGWRASTPTSAGPRDQFECHTRAARQRICSHRLTRRQSSQPNQPTNRPPTQRQTSCNERSATSYPP